jgi:PAS domain S-box-containing protein
MKGFQNLPVRQSEHKYREVFESFGDAVFLADEDSVKIIDANRRAEKLLGCARSEILGHRQSHFLPSLDQGGTNFEESIESELVRPDGSSLAVWINSTQLTVYERPLVLRLCQELTS